MQEAAAPKVSFVSLGCPKALVDSERIITRLRAEGYELARKHDGADIVIVNTCGFLDSAKQESLSAIGDAMAVREALACRLSGFGLEIGAGASPFPVSPLCRVLYGDRLSYEKLVAAPYPGQRPCDIVIPDVLTDFDTLGHMNNAAYWQVSEELLSMYPEIRRNMRAIIEHVNPVDPGTIVRVEIEEKSKTDVSAVLRSDSQLHATMWLGLRR